MPQQVESQKENVCWRFAYDLVEQKTLQLKEPSRVLLTN